MKFGCFYASIHRYKQVTREGNSMVLIFNWAVGSSYIENDERVHHEFK